MNYSHLYQTRQLDKFHLYVFVFSPAVAIVNHFTANGQNQHHNLVAKNTTLDFNIGNICITVYCYHFCDLFRAYFLHQYQVRSCIWTKIVNHALKFGVFKVQVDIFQNNMDNARIKE